MVPTDAGTVPHGPTAALPDPIAVALAVVSPVLALLVLVLALLGAFRVEPGFAHAAGILGLFLAGAFFLGTLISAVALVLLRRVETSKPLAANV